MKPLFAVLLLLTLAACGAAPPACEPDVAETDAVYLVSGGWHTELGVPAARLEGPLAVYRDIFPNVRFLMFGFGKKTFVTAPPHSVSEYILGPVPGPALIQVTGLSVSPLAAYPDESVVTLALPATGARGLSDFLWNALLKDGKGAPRLVAQGPFPGSLFYGATEGYSLLNTCNTWTADALHAAGLPVTGDGVVFSSQAMGRAARAAERQCQPHAPH